MRSRGRGRNWLIWWGWGRLIWRGRGRLIGMGGGRVMKSFSFIFYICVIPIVISCVSYNLDSSIG